MCAEGKKEKKTWPAFASWVSQSWQAIEEAGASKQPSLPPGLYLVATPIGNLGDISLRALWTLRQADAVLCEDTRNTARLLSFYGIKKHLISCHDHNEDSRTGEVLARLAQGQALALVSDAGTPLIADPGYRLVRACRDNGAAVHAIPGASALLTALCSAGLPTDKFLFIGFLPAKKSARQKTLQEIAPLKASIILYESPQRIAESLKDMASILGPTRRAVLMRELTKLYEDSQEATLEELAEHLKEQEVKGEIVLVLAPPEALLVAESAWEDDLRAALANMSIRDAVAVVAKASGVKKSAVYQKALVFGKEN